MPPIVCRKTAEHEVGPRLKRNVVALLGRQREVFKMGLAVVARIYPYDHAGTPSHGEIIVHASLSDAEGVVSESIGTQGSSKRRAEDRFPGITPFRIAQSLPDNN